MGRTVKAYLVALILGITSQSVHADERIWVHVMYTHDYLNALCFSGAGGALPMTYKFRLFNADNYYIEIPAAYSCMDIGTAGACIDTAGSMRYSSAWDIDLITRTEPSTQEQLKEVCGPDNCVPAWYPVDIPTGFEPTTYQFGCSGERATFEISSSNPTNPTDPTNTTDPTPSSDGGGGGGGGGGGCFIYTITE